MIEPRLTAAVLVAAVSFVVLGVGSRIAFAQTEIPELTAAAQEDGHDAALCNVAPGVIAGVCSAVGYVVGGGVRSVVGGGANVVFSALVGFVVDGAGWMLEGVANFIDSSTDPDVTSGWFREAYRDMGVVAGLVVLPSLLLAVLQALLRQDVSMMVHVVLVRVPLAAIGTTVAVVVVDLLIRLTDVMSAWIGRGIGADLSAFATGVGSALASLGGSNGPVVAGLAGLLAAALVAFAAFVIWLELLLRQAAVYVAVLFLPLGFMAVVWPATGHWLRRLVQGLVAIILSKFVIVAVMALAASGIDADVADEGFGVVLAGGSMLALAALAPYVLLKLIPVFDSDLPSHLEGTFRRPTAAVAAPVTGTQMAGILRQRAAGTKRASSPATASGAPAASASGAGGAAAAGVAAGTLGVNAARGAGRAARGRADQVAERASSTARRARPPTSTSSSGAGTNPSRGDGAEGHQ